MNADEIRNIHIKQLAIPGNRYTGDNGRVYIGLSNGSLKLLLSGSETTFQQTDTIKENTVQEAIENIETNTTENAQDAIGDILIDSADIEFTYDDTTPSISALLTVTGVNDGTYGDASNIPQITVDDKGRITSISNISITIPPNFITAISDTNSINLTVTGTTLSADLLTQDTTETDLTIDASGLKVDLKTTGVSAGAYTLGSFTVDSKGRLTVAASGTLTDAKIWIGNGANIPTAVTPSGDATISNTGIITLIDEFQLAMISSFRFLTKN